MTTIYLIRHSNTFNEHKGIPLTNEPLLIENEKSPLSILGEENASLYLAKNEFNNIDTVWSSNYTRAMSTAKYIAYYNNLKVNIDESFNERIHGVDSYKDLPSSFEELQFNNEDYNKYKSQYNNITLKINNKIHDRFIIIDNKDLYHIGASLKDLGKKCFGINKIENIDWLNNLLTYIRGTK